MISLRYLFEFSEGLRKEILSRYIRTERPKIDTLKLQGKKPEAIDKAQRISRAIALYGKSTNTNKEATI